MYKRQGLTSLNGNQWLICIVFAFALLLATEVVKVFLRRSKSHAAATPAAAAPAKA